VEHEEFETKGLRAELNYGHTFGHALELLGGYKRWLHGEAVSLGIMAAAYAAVRVGLLDPAVRDRQERLLLALGLPVPQRRVSACNGWYCQADDLGTPDPDPMCFDQTWLDWMYSKGAGEAPTVTADTVLTEEDRSGRVDPDRDRDHRQCRGTEHEQDGGADDVHRTFERRGRPAEPEAVEAQQSHASQVVDRDRERAEPSRRSADMQGHGFRDGEGARDFRRLPCPVRNHHMKVIDFAQPVAHGVLLSFR